MKCKECGAEYEGHPNSRYCSDKCREKAINDYQIAVRGKYKPSIGPRPCRWCGKVFEPASGKAQVYCCADCRRESIKQQNQNQVRKPKEKIPVLVKCKHCGKEFMALNKKKVFCSIPCRTKYNNVQKRLEKEAIHICDIDGKEKEARSHGMSYGHWQARDMVEKYAKVEVPEWARR